MYAKEEAERILADWAESGMTMSAFCAQPGKPARSTLSVWVRQAEAGLLDIPARKVRGRTQHSKYARYPESTKREALALLAKGLRPCEVARRLGVLSGSVVTSWRRKSEGAKMAPEVVPMAKEGGRAAHAGNAELEARIAELELECAVLKELVRDPKSGGPVFHKINF